MDVSKIYQEKVSGPFDPIPITSIPRIVVQPVFLGVSNDKCLKPDIQVKVEIHCRTDQRPPERVWFCPLLGDVIESSQIDKQTANNMDVYTVKWDYYGEVILSNGLDGHIVQWIGGNPFITCFSYGGNPPTHTTGQPMNAPGSGGNVPPITAGSSNGWVRIYFDVQGSGTVNYESKRFVTTYPSFVADAEKPTPNARIVSSPFSIASSEKVSGIDLNISLEVRYNPLQRDDAVSGTVVICNLQGHSWKTLPTYPFPSLGVPAVATYMDEHSAFRNVNVAELVEHYQLWWIPNADQVSGSQPPIKSQEAESP